MMSQISVPSYASLPFSNPIIITLPPPRTCYPIQLTCHHSKMQLFKSLSARYQTMEQSSMRSITTLQVVSSENTKDQSTKSLEATMPAQPSAASDKPKTRRGRNSISPFISAPLKNMLNQYQILKYPLVTESAIKNIIESNTLVFMVDVRATKADIKEAFEIMFNVQTKKVNTLTNFRGTKKAYITLRPECKAVDVAKTIKII